VSSSMRSQDEERRLTELLRQFDRITHELTTELGISHRHLCQRVIPPIQRDNGRTYRPTRITAQPVVDSDGVGLIGVMVLGTNDINVATPIATDFVHWQLDRGYCPAGAVAGWYRLGIAYGEPGWVSDPEKGSAAVFFTEIIERAAA
jgi:hypothetical protein